MVAKPVTGHSVFSRALLAPGDVGIGTHSARGRHSTCAMAPKPMEYEITDGRRGDETLAQQPPRESSRVRRPPYRNSGYKPSDDAYLYLVAVMDWASRHVLSWRLSNTMDSRLCIEALEAALGYGTPEIFNTDQGAQFTSLAFTDRVLSAGARCSMDGRGRCLDNVFIERLWRSLKYEAVYLHELCDGFEAERVIANWMRFYTEERPHSALGGRTPSEAYRWERAA